MQIEFLRARVKVGKKQLAKLGIRLKPVSAERRDKRRKEAEALLATEPFRSRLTQDQIAELLDRFSVAFR